ncbi:perlucin-like protein [Eurytemora carolleeae]|uniref:perlucin-like protein n=1 Tax=Eurytemora carolleeae TaxID=1294199 RepID=UPI000C78A689|nr:perlucin-like protein [Eurytemora carolleeae]XP_023321236.1 perlucin-like protein [Eurytemora carolleeae]|eukprot:XP_023321235.1 perlucin-like protein [Eurytemora affinis]
MARFIPILFLISQAFGHSLYTQCPPGWISMSPSLGCLLYHTEACGGVQGGGCDWIQATESCQSIGAWLVEIHSGDEQNFIVTMAKALELIHGPLDWWIGLNDLGNEGNWLWQHSRSNLTSGKFSSWGLGEPNGTYLENCAAMSYGSLNYRWSDLGCGKRARTFPICQKF